MNYRIGIDVGGTNTDAVLLDNDKTVIARTKQSTTSDVITGIEQAIASLLKDSDIDKTTITEAMLGTTHCTNAIVERKGLNSVVHFRLGAPATLAIPPSLMFPTISVIIWLPIYLSLREDLSMTAGYSLLSTKRKYVDICGRLKAKSM
ncbi:ROK family protein [Candidatus Fukatsuia symbiotica]|uniref:ROK family protein n=1 Tax=Candidatus Fukatsuia symbiotica TaxID=1878942 RepID=UPI0030841D15